ncbi:MAG: ispD [Gemmatimonadetes bacterium]|nr:ispD [Gemmatimonadota bacterium]
MRSSADLPAAAVIVAGGAGTRLGGAVRKQYLELAGEPVLLRALRPFVDHPGIASVVAVLPPDDAAHPPSWLTALRVTVVPGGAERGDSVWNGLQAIPASVGRVLVHDGARPLVTRAVIDRVLAACGEGGAIAAVQATDTIKQVDAEGRITGTPDRRALWQAQTPQGFPAARLLDAYRRARAEGVLATDDAAVYERYAGPVRVVLGAAENLKVTRPGDLEIAELLLRRMARDGG